jgi:uncharacterized protein with HEPN domain
MAKGGLGKLRNTTTERDGYPLRLMESNLQKALDALREVDSLVSFIEQIYLAAYVRLHFQNFLESSTRISETTCLRFSDYPWDELYQIRQMYVHRYDGVNVADVYADVTTSGKRWMQGIKQIRAVIKKESHTKPS